MYGMLNIIFENGWHDKNFINDRVYGMEDIMAEAKNWPIERVADVTGVKADLIVQITKLYAASKPGTLVWAMGLTQHTIGTSKYKNGTNFTIGSWKYGSCWWWN